MPLFLYACVNKTNPANARFVGLWNGGCSFVRERTDDDAEAEEGGGEPAAHTFANDGAGKVVPNSANNKDDGTNDSHDELLKR